MKIQISILASLIVLLSCNLRPKGFPERMTELRENIAEYAKKFNASELLTDKLIDSVYQLSDTNLVVAINYIDQTISSSKPRLQLSKADLYFLKGDIYYRCDSVVKAIVQFQTCAGAKIDSLPKVLAAVAGCFIKLKDYQTALRYLKKATSLDSTYYWNIGNYYEIINQPDSAISNYQHLYFKDMAAFQYCRDRMDTLTKQKPVLLSELVFHDRQRLRLMLMP